MTPVIRATVAGRAPPPPSHLPMPLASGDPSLSLDVHLAALRQEETLLAFFTFPLLVLTGGLLLFGEFLLATLLATLIVLVFLATHYARRPRITHRLARVLRAIFYKSFTYPGDRRAPRLSLRMSVIVIAVFLLALLRFGKGWGSP
jgi:hypothetical protein